VVEKVALEQVFSEYFGFPSQSSFHQKFSIFIITRSRYNRRFSGRRAEWTLFGLHPHYANLKKGGGKLNKLKYIHISGKAETLIEFVFEEN
jgi:hypothetical protein